MVPVAAAGNAFDEMVAAGVAIAHDDSTVDGIGLTRASTVGDCTRPVADITDTSTRGLAESVGEYVAPTGRNGVETIALDEIFGLLPDSESVAMGVVGVAVLEYTTVGLGTLPSATWFAGRGLAPALATAAWTIPAPVTDPRTSIGDIDSDGEGRDPDPEGNPGRARPDRVMLGVCTAPVPWLTGGDALPVHARLGDGFDPGRVGTDGVAADDSVN